MLIPVFITDGAIIAYLFVAPVMKLIHIYICPPQCYIQSRFIYIRSRRRNAQKQQQQQQQQNKIINFTTSSQPFMDTTYYFQCTSMASKQSLPCKFTNDMEQSKSLIYYEQHRLPVLSSFRHFVALLCVAMLSLAPFGFSNRARFVCFWKAKKHDSSKSQVARNRPTIISSNPWIAIA